MKHSTFFIPASDGSETSVASARILPRQELLPRKVQYAVIIRPMH